MGHFRLRHTDAKSPPSAVLPTSFDAAGVVGALRPKPLKPPILDNLAMGLKVLPRLRTCSRTAGLCPDESSDGVVAFGSSENNTFLEER